MVRALSLACVGADYPNKRGPGRRFEIELCKPGEPIELRPEPKNQKDENAVAIYSCRGVQIGYVTAERAPWIGRLVRDEDTTVKAVFQAKSEFGAWIRVGIGGSPNLPSLAPTHPTPEQFADPDPGFWPDADPVA